VTLARRLKPAAIALGVYGPARRIYRRLLNREAFEQFQTEVRFYSGLIEPNQLCFDIGANIGAKAEALLAAAASSSGPLTVDPLGAVWISETAPGMIGTFQP